MQQFCGFLNVCVCVCVCVCMSVCMSVCGGGGAEGRGVRGVKFTATKQGEKRLLQVNGYNYPKIIAAVEKRCSVH